MAPAVSTDRLRVCEGLQQPPAARWAPVRIFRGASERWYPAGSAAGWETVGAVLPAPCGQSGPWNGAELDSGIMEVHVHTDTRQMAATSSTALCTLPVLLQYFLCFPATLLLGQSHELLIT